MWALYHLFPAQCQLWQQNTTTSPLQVSLNEYYCPALAQEFKGKSLTSKTQCSFQ